MHKPEDEPSDRARDIVEQLVRLHERGGEPARIIERSAPRVNRMLFLIQAQRRAILALVLGLPAISLLWFGSSPMGRAAGTVASVNATLLLWALSCWIRGRSK